MKSYKDKISINAPIEKVWEALIRETRKAAVKGAPVDFNQQNNFKCWIWERAVYDVGALNKENGSASGKKAIVLNLELRSIRDGTATMVEVEQKIMREVEERESKRRWREYFIEPLKLYLEAEYSSSMDIEYHQGG